jgi:mRNA-degrading endonuclease RelE of RelBE toxin-antitoxin system
MSYRIDYDKQPKKFFKKLDKHLIQRILDKIDDTLEKEPVHHGAKTVVGNPGVFRIRIGGYRALYRV